MKAIEFITHATDGIIKVPKEHWKDLGQELRVIILVEDAGGKKDGKRELKYS